MRLASFVAEGETQVGIVAPEQDSLISLGRLDMVDLIADPTYPLQVQEALAGAGKRYPLSAVRLLAPIPRPRRNIFCIGLNYADHHAEVAGSKPLMTDPIIFTKSPTTVIGPEALIESHLGVTAQIDYEAELAVVIGRTGRNIPKEAAYDYLFGYTLINDVSARDVQFKHKQWFMGKSLDTFCPMGPYLVSKEEVDWPVHLEISCRVNGEVRQLSNTRHLIFDIPTLIATLSAGHTLEAGDIIATGTCGGVGMGFDPPRYLQTGDTVEIQIEQLGLLRNQVK
jgi:2-keto-4-pentenoate hydratase/2-oxohepta-3-ene-1,7-dioic acid hydratase in catechol pathway